MNEVLDPQDALLLNVMLAGRPKAVRIDESRLRVHGLLDSGETMMQLHPNCRDEIYLKRVRQLLATHAMDSPEGYPVHLRRWTRMGQLRAEALPTLLLTGEPEAVVAVVHSAGLTDELARLAWWCMPTADNARQMLMRETVVRGTMGKVLADYLTEYLPFEEHPYAIIESVWLILANGLADKEARRRLWGRGEKERAYQAGYLSALPDDIPAPLPAHPEAGNPALATLASSGNEYAATLLRAFSGAGQRFLQAVSEVIPAAMSQEVVNTTLNALAHYFHAVRPQGEPAYSVAEAAERARAEIAGRTPASLAALLEAAPSLVPQTQAMLAIASCASSVASPILARTSASGTLMRRKLEPVTFPLLGTIGALLGS